MYTEQQLIDFARVVMNELPTQVYVDHYPDLDLEKLLTAWKAKQVKKPTKEEKMGSSETRRGKYWMNRELDRKLSGF